jgi:hypothetical protein
MRAHQKPLRRGARVLAVLVALALTGVGCERGEPGGQPGGRGSPANAEARENAERECRLFGRLLGLEELATELEAQSADPEDVATAYAARAPQGQRTEAFEGCLAGVRAVEALEAEGARLVPLAEQAAERAGCSDIKTTPDEGQRHIQEGDPLPKYETTPAASGPHRAAPLPSAVSVYHQPVDEAAAVHNLEHAYVLLYYRAEDPAVAPEIVGMFEALAREFDKVLVAPYRGLPPDQGMAMVAWRRLQRCPPSITAEDAEAVARSFVIRFAGTSVAPEPLGP